VAVRTVLDREPIEGEAYVFCNRAGTRIKLLSCDRHGVWLAVRRRWPLKSGCALPGPPLGESGGPASFGRKLLCDAHACNSVPSNEKCSSDIRPRVSARRTTSARNSAATALPLRRSRFLENTE